MSKELEDIVKNTFEDFEADVNPQVWTNIQETLLHVPSHQGTGTEPGSLSNAIKATGATGKFTALAVTVLTTAVVATIGVIYYFNNENAKEKVTVGSDKVVNIQTPESLIINESTSDNVKPGLKTSDSEKSAVDNPEPGKEIISRFDIKVPVKESTPETMTPKDHLVLQSPASDESAKVHGSSVKQPESKSILSKTENEEVRELIASYQAKPEEKPVAYIIANPVTGNAPLTVGFKNNGYAKSVSWIFGDGNQTDNQHETSYTFTRPGKYKVTLTATDQNNRLYHDEIVIEVKDDIDNGPSSVAEIQNVFTPNGDGYNDLFKVKGSNLHTLQATVFNQAGKQVYQWNDPEGGWDGRISNGSMAREGVYFYIIEAKGKDGKGYQFKGILNLIR